MCQKGVGISSGEVYERGVGVGTVDGPLRMKNFITMWKVFMFVVVPSHNEGVGDAAKVEGRKQVFEKLRHNGEELWNLTSEPYLHHSS